MKIQTNYSPRARAADGSQPSISFFKMSVMTFPQNPLGCGRREKNIKDHLRRLPQR